MLDQYTQTLLLLFQGLGRRFDDQEQAGLREALAHQLKVGFEASPYSKVIIRFHTEDPPSTALVYEIAHESHSISNEYDEWLRSRTGPLFGAHPDAKVISLAQSFARPPHTVAVLDIGAGTGRNTLALAKAGFAVDAVELAPALAELLRKELQRENLTARVFVGDALDPAIGIPEQTYQLIILAEVVPHFRAASQLRQLFEAAARWLAPGGLVLFSSFLAADGYEPDALAREASQVFWSSLFTRRELEVARRGLPLAPVSDESVYAFEQRHLPEDAWPPTEWFPSWIRGFDVFAMREGKPPHELRWVVYRKLTAPIADAEEWHTTSVTGHVRADWQRVFDAITDVELASRLFKGVVPLPGILKREYSASGHPTPGTARKCSWSDGSTTHEVIGEFERPRRYTYRWANTLRGPLALLFAVAEADWTLVPTPSGTAMYWTYRVRPRHRILKRGINIVQGAFARFMRAGLQAVCEHLEERATEREQQTA